MNSLILNKSREFMDLCELPTSNSIGGDGKQPRLNLLYRASRDGYQAASFHSKCDDRANTITVIETTRGCIFGGFTRACWTSAKAQYRRDPDAFLFSLVSSSHRPFVCKIKKDREANAIYCDAFYGPTFGSSDIVISDKSSFKPHNLFAAYQAPVTCGSTGADGNENGEVYLGDERYFQVKEIEVFQIETS